MTPPGGFFAAGARGVLLCRADAGTAMGSGHAYRLLALAQAWRAAGGRPVFVSAFTTPAIASRLRAEAIPLRRLVLASAPGGPEDARRTAEFMARENAQWTAVDGYDFGAVYQAALAKRGRLLAVDDHGHAGRYAADLVLNPNFSAGEHLYARRTKSTRLLLGARYVVLRREFWPWIGRRRTVRPRAFRVLATFGGTDVARVAERLAGAVNGLPRLAMRFAAGGRPAAEAYRRARSAGHAVTAQADVVDMPAWMAWADAAVSASGTTAWELAFMGLPSLLVAVADNQRAVGASLARAGACRYLGGIRAATERRLRAGLADVLGRRALRQEMAERAQRMVDGHGARRVLAALWGEPIWLKPADVLDAEKILDWANDPDARAMSFTRRLITRVEHGRWFAQRLADPQTLMRIAMDDTETPVGQVRIEPKPGGPEISVGLDRVRRGQGLGRLLIRRACAEYAAVNPGVGLFAYIQESNRASVRAFLAAGFRSAGRVRRGGFTALRYVWRATC